MGIIEVRHDKCDLCKRCIEVCPFGAVEVESGRISINSACKICKLCIKKCPKEAIVIAIDPRPIVNKEDWKGVMVFVEHQDGKIHPVTFELIGKARQLAGKINHPVYCVFIGSGIGQKAKELINYGVDRIFVYDYEPLKHYRVDVYADVFENCINRVKPAIILVGATSVGRSLAPRLSTRFRTGLTADCTKLEVKENTDLVQIRPAFGGNIMAQIITTNTRPQFATVRYKVMDAAERIKNPSGTVEECHMDEEMLESNIKVIKVAPKETLPGISDAEVLVVAGRGLKEQMDLQMLEELAALLGGQTAVTRPLVEAGWASYTKQIGLSGRTVKPRLIITCGVSGAVQFTSCMNTSEYIFAINKDKNAPIFRTAHYGVVGDLYEVVPELIRQIKEGKEQ